MGELVSFPNGKLKWPEHDVEAKLAVAEVRLLEAFANLDRTLPQLEKVVSILETIVSELPDSDLKQQCELRMERIRRQVETSKLEAKRVQDYMHLV